MTRITDFIISTIALIMLTVLLLIVIVVMNLKSMIPFIKEYQLGSENFFSVLCDGISMGLGALR